MADKDWDESVLDDLPAEAQSRFVRVMRDLVVADVCQGDGVDPGELIKELPDPIAKNVGPDEYRRLAQIAAIEKSNPLAGTSHPDGLFKIWQESQGRDPGGGWFG